MLKSILNQIEAALKDGNYDQAIIDEWHDQYYNTNLAMHISCLFSLESILRLIGIKNGTESRIIVVATQMAMEEEFEAEQQGELDFLMKNNLI